MSTTTVYSTKAEKYAKYRWDYAESALEAIFAITQLSSSSSVADLGAGTGILTRHFVGKVKRIYAIEPNAEMRRVLSAGLGDYPRVSVLAGCAEATTLAQKSVDLITVAQAIHWFEPQLARAEIMRVLKNRGWLAILRNYGIDEELNRATVGLMKAEYGADFSVASARPAEKPISYYYGNEDFQKIIFPFQFQQNWEEFIGALISASYMPDETNPLFKKLENEARQIFSRYSIAGCLTVHGETELFLGQPSI